MSRRTFNLALGAIIALALAVRIFAAFEVNSIVPQSDAADFDRHALSITAGHGYPEALPVLGGPGPSAFRPPLYPVVLSAVYLVTDTTDESERWLAARLEQALIGTLVVALIALIAFQLWGRRPALIAAGIAAIYPPLIHAGTSLLTEPLFTALVLGAIAALLRYRLTDERRRWIAVAGLCAGLAALTRGNGLAVVLALAIGAWTLRPRMSLRALAGPVIVVGCAALVVVPWTVRNAVVMDAFVPVTDQTGVAIGGQYNDIAKANDWSWVGPWIVPAYRSLYKGPPLGEAELGKKLTDRGIDYALDHPGAVPAVAFHNTLRLLSLHDPVAFERSSAAQVGESSGLAQASVYAFWVLGLVAIAGAFTPAARRVPGFVWLLVALLVLSIVFVAGSGRYRAPLEPIVVLLAAAAVDWALSSRARWPS
jgi:4-amino-4-deoxy-L-arabinose transferase-like glycosyltransferase